MMPFTSPFILFSTEITAFSDRHTEFEKLNTEIVGVSVDSVVRFLSLHARLVENSRVRVSLCLFYVFSHLLKDTVC